MRLWSIDPKFLDRQGLLACWREALLAQAVLLNKTKGYKNHPQLQRFRDFEDPVGAIGAYLLEIYKEGNSRQYHFDCDKIYRISTTVKIPVTIGQLNYEINHLNTKLTARSGMSISYRLPQNATREYYCNPIFYLIPGDVESWEKVI